jgi:hypothetical protein
MKLGPRLRTGSVLYALQWLWCPPIELVIKDREPTEYSGTLKSPDIGIVLTVAIDRMTFMPNDVVTVVDISGPRLRLFANDGVDCLTWFHRSPYHG